ncbi:MAG: DUF3592 domain-containing protein [Chthoniobacteraceae bacterium]
MNATPNSSPGNGISLSFVSVIFLVFGLIFFTAMVLYPAWKSHAARDWRQTPCKILSSGVKSSHDGDGTSYAVDIRYLYEVDGKPYESDRYQFLKFSSSGHQSKQAVAARYRKGSRAVCYVNPRNPSDAVLDRSALTVGWWGCFPLVFVGIGVGGLVLARRNRLCQQAASGGEPWMQRADWAAGRVVSHQKGAGLTAIFAAGFCGIGFPIAYMVLTDEPIRKGHLMPGVLVLLFPLIGLASAAAALWMGARWLRFGTSIFEMATVPGAVGGVLEGTIRVRRPLFPRGPVKLWLQAISRTTQRTSDGNSTVETPLWDHRAEVSVEPGATAIPVAFRIPADAPATSVIGSGEGVLWRLEARAEVPGIDYKTQWEVPIYEMEVSPEEKAEAAQMAQAEAVEAAAYVPPVSSPIRVEPALGGGTAFYFPARRNLKVQAPFIVGFLVITVVLVAMFQRHDVPWVMLVGFGFFDVLFGFTSISALTGSLRVVVSPEGVRVTKYLMGIPRVQTLQAAEIREIATVEGSIRVGARALRSVAVITQDDDRVMAGTDLQDPLEAEWLARRMSAELGIAAVPYDGEIGR